MLRDSVPPDIFVSGPDYSGSVGTRVLDIYGDGALEFLKSIDRATLAKGSVLIRGDAPNVTAYMGRKPRRDRPGAVPVDAGDPAGG